MQFSIKFTVSDDHNVYFFHFPETLDLAYELKSLKEEKNLYLFKIKLNVVD